MKHMVAKLVLCAAIVGGATVAVSVPQEPPASASIVRNDSPSRVSFEWQSGGTWMKATLEAGKDLKLRADRIRVSTTREDDAVLTVDLPIQTGKKYRVFWNPQTSMWDLGGTA